MSQYQLVFTVLLSCSMVVQYPYPPFYKNVECPNTSLSLLYYFHVIWLFNILTHPFIRMWNVPIPACLYCITFMFYGCSISLPTLLLECGMSQYQLVFTVLLSCSMVVQYPYPPFYKNVECPNTSLSLLYYFHVLWLFNILTHPFIRMWNVPIPACLYCITFMFYGCSISLPTLL